MKIDLRIYMSKKIGFILEFFPPNRLSSAILPFQIAEYLLQKNHTVSILTSKEKNDENFNMELKIKYSKLFINRFKYYRSKKNKLSKILSFFSFFFNALFRIKAFKKFDFVFVFSNPPINSIIGYLIHKIYKVRIIFVIYDFYPDIAYFSDQIKHESFSFKLFSHFNKLNYRDDNKVVVLSNDMKEFVSHKFPSFKESIYVIPNWYKDSSDLFTTPFESNKIKIGYFGNIGVTQDIELIKKVLFKFKNNIKIEFNFAIHGNYVEDLKKFISLNKIENISIFPFLNEIEFHRLLMKQTFVLVTLNKNIQKVASPSRVYSFLMAGKPIILCQYGESELSREIESNNLGYFLDFYNKGVIDNFSITKTFNSKNIQDYVKKNNDMNFCLDKYAAILE